MCILFTYRFAYFFHFSLCSQVNFSVILQPKSKVVESEFDFSFEVNSSIAQVAALSNTTAHFRIPIFENATLKIDG